jgi:hypothetical protein
LFLAVLFVIKKVLLGRSLKVLSNALEPLSMSAVHYPAKNVSEIRVAKEPRYRRCIAVDETATCMHICGLLWTWILGNYWLWRSLMVGAA